MAASVLISLIAIVGLPLFVWWLVVLIEAVKTPGPQWDAAGQSLLVHVLLMLFLGVIGTIIYLVVAKPRLRAVAS